MRANESALCLEVGLTDPRPIRQDSLADDNLRIVALGSPAVASLLQTFARKLEFLVAKHDERVSKSA